MLLTTSCARRDDSYPAKAQEVPRQALLLPGMASWKRRPPDGHGVLDASGIPRGAVSWAVRLSIVTKFSPICAILTPFNLGENDKKNRKYDGEMPEKPKQRPNDRYSGH